MSNGGVKKFVFRIAKPFVSILFVRSGRRGRGFESRHLDQIRTTVLIRNRSPLFFALKSLLKGFWAFCFYRIVSLWCFHYSAEGDKAHFLTIINHSETNIFHADLVNKLLTR